MQMHGAARAPAERGGQRRPTPLPEFDRLDGGTSKWRRVSEKVCNNQRVWLKDWQEILQPSWLHTCWEGKKTPKKPKKPKLFSSNFSSPPNFDTGWFNSKWLLLNNSFCWCICPICWDAAVPLLSLTVNTTASSSNAAENAAQGPDGRLGRMESVWLRLAVVLIRFLLLIQLLLWVKAGGSLGSRFPSFPRSFRGDSGSKSDLF